MVSILEVISPIAIALVFAEWSGIPQGFSSWLYKIGIYRRGLYTKTRYRLKPFDCGFCLTFWIALIQNHLHGYSYYTTFALACLSASIAYIILTIHARINR